MEPHQRRHPPGKEGEAARNQGAMRAMRPHRRHQLRRARGQDRFFPGALQRGDGQPGQHAHAFPQRRLEVQLAVHGAGGDGGDPLLQPGEGGQFVQRLRRDDGAVHVGQQQALAATFLGQGHGVHRRLAQRGAGGGAGLVRREIGEGQVGRFFRREPVRAAAFGAQRRQRGANRGKVRGREAAWGGDERQDVRHAPRGMAPARAGRNR